MMKVFTLFTAEEKKKSSTTHMLRFNYLRFARPKPNSARSWKQKPSATATHFTYVSERDINQGKTAESVAKEKHQAQQQQQQFQATSDASAATAKYGNSIFSLLKQINPATNVDVAATRPWLRRGVVWAQTVKLTEFGHISNFLAPAYIGTGFACTVAVVRESCDTLAIQVPFIPIHLAMLHMLTIWSVTCSGYLLQKLVARYRGDKTVLLTYFDGTGAMFVHMLCGTVLLLGHHFAALQVVAFGAAPLIALNFFFQVQQDYKERIFRENQNINNNNNNINLAKSTAASAATNKKSLKQKSATESVISKVMKEDVLGDHHQTSTETKDANAEEKASNSQDDENNNNNQQSSNPQDCLEPSRVSILVSSCLTAIPVLIGYSSLLGRFDPIVTVPVCLAACCWGGMWHTFRGGNALFFSWDGRKRIKIQLFILSGASYTLLNLAGIAAGQTLFYYAFLGWSWYHMLGVIDHFRPGDLWSISVAQKRLRSSMWLIFLAICAGNLLWVLLVAAVAEIKEVDPEDDTKLIEHPPIAEQQKTKSSVLAKILTLTVQPTGYTSMDQFSWADRMVKPILVYASLQKDPSSAGNEEKKQQPPAETSEKKSKHAPAAEDNTRKLGDAVSMLDSLEIPVYYRREYLGENVVYLLSKSGMVSPENVNKFEHKYLSFCDHYSPYGAI